jgi:t-SNARE complex subunit (syntaxin)
MDQLLALSVKPRDQDSTAKSLTSLKTELAEEKIAWEMVQAENETLACTVEDLKKSADGFTAQIHVLEEKIKHLDNKVLDGLTEFRAQELNMERTTKAKEDFKNQTARLTRKQESKFPFLCCLSLCLV